MEKLGSQNQVEVPADSLSSTGEEVLSNATEAVAATPRNVFHDKKSLKRPAVDEAEVDDDATKNIGDSGPAKKKRRKVNWASKPRVLSEARIERNAYVITQRTAVQTSSKAQTNIKPRQLVAEAIRRLARDNPLRDPSRRFPDEPPTAAQLEIVNRNKDRIATYVSRTASLERGLQYDRRPSSGHTETGILMPDAETREGHRCHTHIHDLKQSEGSYMTGSHLQWINLCGDELLSYTESPIFNVGHCLLRRHSYQEGVTIQYLDTRLAMAADDTSEAAFYPALDLYEAYRVPEDPMWKERHEKKLRSRVFTQEFFSHGTIIVNDSRFKQAPSEHLIRDGLYDILPALYVPRKYKRAGLYEGQVALRRQGYPPERDLYIMDGSTKRRAIYSYDRCATNFPFTIDLLTTVQRVTRNFMAPISVHGPEAGGKVSEPHLHIFLQFLTFQKRPSRDVIFMKWIKEHYDAADVLDLYKGKDDDVIPGFTHVADNLPEVMQYIDLVRDAGSVFSLADLPRTVVERVNLYTRECYAGTDARLQKRAVSSQEYADALLKLPAGERNTKHRTSMERAKEKAAGRDATDEEDSGSEPEEEYSDEEGTEDGDQETDQDAEDGDAGEGQVRGLLTDGQELETLEQIMGGSKNEMAKEKVLSKGWTEQ